MLKKGDLLYILTYDPIAINIVEINDKIFTSCSNESYYSYKPVIIFDKIYNGKHGGIWIENTLNLNKLIKEKYLKRFISVNKDLILKRYEILIKYENKNSST